LRKCKKGEKTLNNELKIFENPAFSSIRTVEMDGTPYFVGKDVADVLGYERPAKAIADHVDEEDRDEVPIQDSIGRMQKTPVINESGLYSLILSSKLPKAKEFKHWVTSEVLPAIRKHGMYATEELLDNPDFAIKVFAELKAEREKRKVLESTVKEQEQQIQADKPKVVFADAVTTSKTSILIGDLAKLLKQNGIAMGQKRLFEWLRSNGYLIKSGSSKNMPIQRYMEQGLFEVKESVVANPDGSSRVTRTTKITGKGQQYFINRFLSAT
jgi:anti-repressor protein